MCKEKDKPTYWGTVLIQSPRPQDKRESVLDDGVAITPPDRSPKEKNGSIASGKVIDCDICGKGFRSVSSLNKHRRGVHMGIKPFKCQEPGCSSRFQYKKSLENHVKTVHMKIKPYVCCHCYRKFSDMSNRNKHISRLHKTE